MIRKLLISLIPIAAAALFTGSSLSDNGKAGRTGSPGETTCTNCHNSYALNSGGGSVTIQSSGMTGNQYNPGQVYNMSVTVAKTGIGMFGIGLEALTTSNTNAGTLAITDAASTTFKTATVSGAPRQNLVHKLNGGLGSDSKVFNFNWTAPPAGTGNVTFYFSGVAANANTSDNGDYVYAASQVFTESVSCTSTPVQPGSINGNAVTCPGTSVTYSVPAVTDATAYTWTIPSGWTGTSSTNSITLIAGNTPGSISVTASNSCGNSPTTFLGVTLTTAAASITANGNVLEASQGTSYEWYFNGVFITGAVNSTYAPAAEGNYVVVVYNNGCHASSSPFVFTFVGIKIPDVLSNLVNVFPNPASDRLTIEAPSELNNSKLFLYSSSGKLVLQGIIHQGMNTLNLDQLSEGVYNLSIDDKSVKRILVTR